MRIPTPIRFLTLAATAFTLCAFSVFPTRAHAQAPAVSFTATDAFNNVEASTLGWGFTVSAPIWVTSLGYYDYSADPSQPVVEFGGPDNRTSGGLLDDHTVGLFDSTGNLLTSAEVPSGTAGTLMGDSRYSSIPTIELTPGQYFVEGTQQGASGTDPTDPVAYLFSSFSPIPEITVSGGVYTGGAPGVLTFADSGAYQGYLGPNFLASDTPPSAAPEPSAWASGIASLGGLLLLVRRSRTRKLL